MPSSRSLLMCFAHPDDESFFAAGTARKYVEAGVRVVLCCATRGERGSVGDPPLATIDSLPQVREQELRNAAEILGIPELVLLDYRDQELAAAPPAEICERIGALIRQHRPEVVMTFDPNGGNRHPDHMAISRFTADAIPFAADPRWHPEFGEAHRVRRVVWAGATDVWQRPSKFELAERPGVDFLMDVGAWRETKARALLAHRTQRGGVDRVFLNRPDRDAVLSLEIFRLGAGDMPGSVPADDLFAGVA